MGLSPFMPLKKHVDDTAKSRRHGIQRREEAQARERNKKREKTRAAARTGRWWED